MFDLVSSRIEFHKYTDFMRVHLMFIEYSNIQSHLIHKYRFKLLFAMVLSNKPLGICAQTDDAVNVAPPISLKYVKAGILACAQRRDRWRKLTRVTPKSGWSEGFSKRRKRTWPVLYFKGCSERPHLRVIPDQLSKNMICMLRSMSKVFFWVCSQFCILSTFISF